MKIPSIFLVLVFLVLAACQVETENNLNTDSASEDERASKFIEEREAALIKTAEKLSYVEWDYATNINDENEKRKVEAEEVLDALNLKIGNEAKQFQLDKINVIDVKRKLGWLRNIETSALDPEKLKKFHESTNTMTKIYNTAKVPSYQNPKILLNLEPEISGVFAQSRDPKELEHYWNEWHKLSGGRMREDFLVVTELTNEAARLNGFKDGTEMKILDFESDTFVQEMAETWEGLKPLYEQLHAYIRSKLFDIYGDDIIDPSGPIPAHLLGNIWAQTWNNIGKLLLPFPEKQSIDVTPAMKEKGWTTKTMYQKADEFFISLGLEPMREEFWENSILEHPNDGRQIQCHPQAFEFFNGKDYRIKHCATVTAQDFIVANHEMGHIQYFMSYSNQSFSFRNGANSGFHEAVGDTIGLSAGTTNYYKQLGLIPEGVNVSDDETDINILFENALQYLVFLPFGYLVDKYRWDLYSGEASTDDLNCHWVKLRADIQGVAPPNQRNEEMFDAGAKFHIAANAGYVQYFTAHIYEFQFYKALCQAAGQYEMENPDKPLHRCNFYGSKEAGKKLIEMLALGKSKPWKETIEIMTGTPKMDTRAFREYFAPLEKWLKKQNEEKNVQVGWTVKDFEKLCKKSA